MPPIALAVSTALVVLTMPIHSPAAAADMTRSSEGPNYVLFASGSGNSTMSGSTDDLRRARALRAGREGLLYIRDGRTAYVIRDAATLRQAAAIFKPQVDLGARQAALGSRQAALGERQARLGGEQARLGAQQASASPARATELGRQQDSLGRQQDVLGRQQDALGRQQDALGRQQDRLASLADAKMRTLLAEAIRRGVAQRVK